MFNTFAKKLKTFFLLLYHYSVWIIDWCVYIYIYFLKHLGDVATLLRIVLFLHVIPDRLDDDQIRSLCGARAVAKLPSSKNLTGMWVNVWKCKLIFSTDTLQQKIEITDLKLFFSKKKRRYSNNLDPYCMYKYKYKNNNNKIKRYIFIYWVYITYYLFIWELLIWSN